MASPAAIVLAALASACSGNSSTCAPSDCGAGETCGESGECVAVAGLEMSHGGTGDDQGNAVATDAFGNTYVAGAFAETATLCGESIASAGSDDLFAFKVNPSGGCEWVVHGGGEGLDSAVGIAVDNTGNTYIAGFTTSSQASFGSFEITLQGMRDGYVAKIDSSGQFEWVMHLPAAAGGRVTAGPIVADAAGVHIAATFDSTVGVGDQMLTSAGGEDFFVAQLTPEGTVEWLTRVGTQSSESAYKLRSDSLGNLYVAGLNVGASFAGIVTKLSQDGTAEWTSEIGGAGFSIAWDIVVSSDDGLFAVGQFDRTVSFGSIELTATGNLSAFVAQLDSAGVFTSARSVTGSSEAVAFAGASDGAGGLYVAGNFDGTATLSDSLSLTDPDGVVGDVDVFVAHYDPTNGFDRAAQGGSSVADDRDVPLGLAIDATGRPVVTGFFVDAMALSAASITSVGKRDVFVWTVTGF